MKDHPFFSSINWDLLAEKKVAAPYVPMVRSKTDIRNIDTDFTNDSPIWKEDPSQSLPYVEAFDFFPGIINQD